MGEVLPTKSTSKGCPGHSLSLHSEPLYGPGRSLPQCGDSWSSLVVKRGLVLWKTEAAKGSNQTSPRFRGGRKAKKSSAKTQGRSPRSHVSPQEFCAVPSGTGSLF